MAAPAGDPSADGSRQVLLTLGLWLIVREFLKPSFRCSYYEVLASRKRTANFRLGPEFHRAVSDSIPLDTANLTRIRDSAGVTVLDLASLH